MKKAGFYLSILVFISFTLIQAGFCHGLWVNVHKNDIHPPGHVITSVGFGHIPPMDDLLTSTHGTLALEAYRLVDPQNTMTDLPKPDLKVVSVETASPLAIFKGDLGTCRMGLAPDSHTGTYTVAARAEDTFYSVWMDQKGEIHRGIKAMDEIKNPKKILTSMLYKANAKAFFTKEAWSEPRGRGYDLELSPVSDLSAVKVGDEVTFKASFMGKPLNSGMKGLHRVTGISRSFGMTDKTFLMSYLQNGTCTFRMPGPGQWLMQVNLKKAVDKTPGLADLKGKCQTVAYTASLTFHVIP